MAPLGASKAIGTSPASSSTSDSAYQTSLFLFGLWNTPTPLLFLAAASIVALRLFLLPKIAPGKILPATEEQIREVEAFLHDEAARRRSIGMAIIYAHGLERLDGYVEAFCGLPRFINYSSTRLKARVRDLSETHRALCQFRCIHRYIRSAYSLCIESRHCLREVQAIRDELHEEVTTCSSRFLRACGNNSLRYGLLITLESNRGGLASCTRTCHNHFAQITMSEPWRLQ